MSPTAGMQPVRPKAVRSSSHPLELPMQIVISPAKQMRIENDAFSPAGIPPFPHKTVRIIQELIDIEADQGEQALKTLWNVSDRLLAESLETLHRFQPVKHPGDLLQASISTNISPALLSYHGIQYQSIAAEVMDDASLNWLQKHLWILSGLYGCARPFHGIQPYRLEIGAKLAIDRARNLYDFWSHDLAEAIAQPKEAVVNLASVEYAKAVIPHLPANTPMITCIFAEEIRNGKPRQVSSASKAARGTMVRWLAEQRSDDPSIVERFDIGYALNRDLSSPAKNENSRTVVFVKQ